MLGFIINPRKLSERPVWLLTGAFIMVLLLLSGAVQAQGDDAYLKALEAEAQKVGAKKDGGGDEKASAASPSADIASFEQELKENYQGSYTFYSRLPPRSQEEIFADYKGGASIADIRKKIMNRFLHKQ